MRYRKTITLAIPALLFYITLGMSTGNKALCEELLVWEPLPTTGLPHARHEAGFLECDGKLYLLGGRRVQPIDIFDPETRTWTAGASPPIEVHHVQPVVWDHRIWLVGAMTGRYPHETAIDRILIYDPRNDSWSWGPEIPTDRRRGGAGAVVDGESIYLVCGIQNGHWDGWVPWLDRFDLKTESWLQLPDAPRSRDHFHAAVVGGKLFAAGGRRTSGVTKEVFALTVPEVDVFDIEENEWSTLPAESNLPIPRAGCFAFSRGNELFIAGGESAERKTAHEQIHALNTITSQWRIMSTFARGRHGTGIARHKDLLYTCGGSGNRGGSPELDTTEFLELSKTVEENIVYENDFEVAAGDEWSQKKTSVTPIGERKFLGEFGPESASLALKDLPGHKFLRMSFDLILIKSWDGNSGWGPDIWELNVEEGQRLVYSTFSNCGFFTVNDYQTFPDNHPVTVHKAWTGAAEKQSLGYRFFGEEGKGKVTDGLYRIEVIFPHTAPNIQFNFISHCDDLLNDQSWGVDNVSVETVTAATRLTDDELTECWKTFFGDDPVVACQSIWKLVASDEQAVEFLDAMYPTEAVESSDEVDELLHQLDDDNYEVREQAMQSLQELGPGVAPILTEALKKTTAIEVRFRINAIIKHFTEQQAGANPAERVARYRAARVLEIINTERSRELRYLIEPEPRQIGDPTELAE